MGQSEREGKGKVTKKDLQKLKYLDSDLRVLRRHLRQLEASLGISAMPSDGQPHGNKIGRPTEEQALQLAHIVDQIRSREAMIAKVKREVWSFVLKLDDPLLRQIIILRFIDGKSWFKVAEEVGGDVSADGCRMIFNRAKIDD